MLALGETLALLSAFFWGNSGVVLKSVPQKYRLTFIFLESIMSGIIIISLIFILDQWKDFSDFTVTTTILAIIAAVINVSGSVFYIFAIKHVKVGMAFVVINSLFPLFSIIGGVIFLNQILSLPIYVGGIIIITGIAVITLNGKGRLSFSEPRSSLKIGLFFCTITPLCWGSGALMMDKLLEEQGVLPLILIRAATIFVFFAILLLIWKRKDFYASFTGDPQRAKKIIFASILTTFAMLGWFTSLSLSDAALTIILGSSAPIFAVISARIFLKESFSKRSIFGILICISGVLTVII